MMNCQLGWKVFCLVVNRVWWEGCRYCRWGDWGHLKEHVSIFAMIPSIEDNNLQKLFYANKYDAVCIILAFQIATSVWGSPPVKTWSWSWFPYSSWRLSHVPSFLRLPLCHFCTSLSNLWGLFVSCCSLVAFLWYFIFLSSVVVLLLLSPTCAVLLSCRTRSPLHPCSGWTPSRFAFL